MKRMEIFSENEMMARYHVRLERYVKSLFIEAGSLRELVDTMIMPAAFGYHGNLVKAAADAKMAGVKAPQADVLVRLSDLLTQAQVKRAELDSAMSKADALASEDDKAKALSEKVLPAMEALRGVCDELELAVADDYWPLPKYREMLFL
jgi:glutamine synthetase